MCFDFNLNYSWEHSPGAISYTNADFWLLRRNGGVLPPWPTLPVLLSGYPLPHPSASQQPPSTFGTAPYCPLALQLLHPGCWPLEPHSLCEPLLETPQLSFGSYVGFVLSSGSSGSERGGCWAGWGWVGPAVRLLGPVEAQGPSVTSGSAPRSALTAWKGPTSFSRPLASRRHCCRCRIGVS